MIRCEHFLYGQFNGVGYRLIKSKGVDDCINKDSLDYLCMLDGVEPARTWLPNEQYVARTYFGTTYDEYNRRNRWNHTILLYIVDYLNIVETAGLQAIDKHFIKETDKPPKNLKPLEIEEQE